jgi:hypothetical protein
MKHDGYNPTLVIAVAISTWSAQQFPYQNCSGRFCSVSGKAVVKAVAKERKTNKEAPYFGAARRYRGAWLGS